ncbi:MAG TPA: lipopolysaccharide heptosyltransferase II [Candidatus Acidoferrales bacterium]|nr:lipopolysaccharide heptosyltransferase II [Candidatus Acidoferrales bacterium]
MKILVRATNWVGDAILSIPALQAIRERQPKAEITILARRWVSALYRGQGLANELLVLEDLPDPVSALRGRNFDIAILLQNAFHAAFLVSRANIPERIGYARDGRSWLLTRAVPVPTDGEIPLHESFYYLELLRRAGWIAQLPRQLDEIRLQVSPEDRARAAKQIIAAGARPSYPRIAFAPGAAYGSAKCWPAERFARLSDRLIARYGADVVLFGAPSERDIAGRIASGMRYRPVNLAGETSIEDLPAYFSTCDLFIGNDSGAMHVAAATGIPVVAIFGSTDPNGTAPVTPRRTLVRRAPSCSPCFLRRCPVDHRCMTSIEVQFVEDAAAQWLGRASLNEK